MVNSWLQFQVLAGILVVVSQVFAQKDEYKCSPTSPCKIGCCGKNGVCSFGPTSCAPENCESDCDRKSDCDPGWGAQWSQNDKCPLNVCCSKFGFCGTDSDFCGDKKVQSPSCSGTSSNKRTIGYYEGWSTTRACDGMWPESIPVSAYTHLNYAFAFVNPSSFEVVPMSDNDLNLYKRFTGLKDSNPGLETWISIGGWSMNDLDQPTKTTFSDLAGSSAAQDKFIKSLLSFMSTYGFDGVDMDWEYPGAPERSGKDIDKANYNSFLAKLKGALGSDGHKRGLSITIPSSYWYMRHFDIVEIGKHIDFFNVMTYDIHGTWDSTIKSLGPIVNSHTNLTEIDSTLELLWRNNIEPEKVNLGLGFYGRSFTLSDPNCKAAGCGFSAGAKPGKCTANAGTLSFAEIQRIVAGGAQVTTDEKAAVKIVTWDKDQWVSYDDRDTFKMKIDYANKRCLGGTMIWAVSTDDEFGTASAALSGSTGRQAIALKQESKKQDPISQCQWGECGKQCPSGFSAATRGDKGGTGTATLYNGCSSPITGGKDRAYRPYCCPSNDVPNCEWRGSAPFCNGKCHNDEVEVTSDTAATGKYCFLGHKVLCCKSTKSDEAEGKCKWYGAGPACTIFSWQHYGCPKNTKELTYDKYGSGGESGCHPTGGYKSLCCSQPPPYKNCDWYYHGNKFWGSVPFFCGGSCPNGKHPIASDPYLCVSGAGLFCCDSPSSSTDAAQSTVHNLLNLFKADPTCSKGERAFSKRDALTSNDWQRVQELSDERDIYSIPQSELRDLNITEYIMVERLLEKRQSGNMLSPTQEKTLIGLLSAAFIAYRAGNGGTNQQVQIRKDFDSTLGKTLNVNSQDFVDQYNLFPHADPSYLTESLMCQGSQAGNFVKAAKKIKSQSCRAKCNCSCRLGSNRSKAKLSKRVIQQGWDRYVNGPNQEPNVETMLHGVVENNPRMLEYLYTRLIHYQGREGIIELAWRIPPGTGDGTNSNDPNTYRGRENNPPDNYFVVHLHVDHLYHDRTTNTRWPGIYTVQAFHGQYINQANRVDGNSVTNRGRQGRNDRVEILECNTNQQGDNVNVFYPGYQNDGLLNQFGQALRNRGYVGDRTLRQVENGQPGDDCIVPLDWGQLPNGDSGSMNPDGTPWTNPNGYRKL